MKIDKAAADELVRLTLNHSSEGEMSKTAIKGLQTIRSCIRSNSVHVTYEPSICFIVQGAKMAVIGNHAYRYGISKYFITAVTLPVTCHIVEASARKPYLCLVLKLDPVLIYEVISRLNFVPHKQSATGNFIGNVDFDLAHAFLRLMRTLSSDHDVAILAPLIIQEITYLLLRSKQGSLVRELGIAASQTQKVSRAINLIRENFNKPVRIDQLANMVDMSATPFHEAFKKVTTLSPIQYQKELRLQEARRILSTEISDAASVGLRVGYESTSQFSREYARRFGLPPKKDVGTMRGITGAELPASH